MPSHANTLVRWSAAELPNGGLNAAGGWDSVFGGITANKIGAGNYVYSHNGNNGKPCLLTPVLTGAGAYFEVPAITLPNPTMASIVVLKTNTTDTQVPFEIISPDQNRAIFIEYGSFEGYYVGLTSSVMKYIPQFNTPAVIATGYDRNIDFRVNGVQGPYRVGNPDTVINSVLGTARLTIGARNGGQFFHEGHLCAVHIFHTKPSAAEMKQWASYYYNLYNITT